MKKSVTQIDLPNHPPYLYPDYKSTVKRSPTKTATAHEANSFRADRPCIWA